MNRTSYSFGAMPHFMITSLQATYEFVTEALVKNSMDNPVAPNEEVPSFLHCTLMGSNLTHIDVGRACLRPCASMSRPSTATSRRR